MKRRNGVRIVSALLMMALMTGQTLAVDTGYGASAVQDGINYTLEQMLTYALQDEYLAHAEYEGVLKNFVQLRTFSNIMRAEQKHIEALEPLFEKYGVVLPADEAMNYVKIPETLLEASQAGVEAEVKNIAMYDSFLKQKIPSDVKAVFIDLKNASLNHLKAFKKGVARLEGGVQNN